MQGNPTRGYQDLVDTFGQVVGVEKATSLVSGAAERAGIDAERIDEPQQVIRVCRDIESAESGVLSNVAHEVRVRTQMETRFEELFGLIPDPAMVVAREYDALTVESINDAGEATFGTERARQRSVRLRDLLDETDPDDVASIIEERLGDDAESRIEATVHDGGRDRHFIVRIAPVTPELFGSVDENRAAVPIATDQGILFFTEITRQKRQRETLERLQQVTNVLNRILRHNLRNDMNVILGHGERIEWLNRGDSEIDSAVETITSTAEDLLALSENARQIEAAVGSIERREIDVVPVLKQSLQLIEAEYDAVEIETRLPDSVPVLADQYLGVAIKNALDNAVSHNDKATPRVWVRIERCDRTDDVTVQIADDGPGIPDREIDVLDQGFGTPLKHGTGLGVWLIHWIVSQYGGDLTFEDREPTGTTVTMRLRCPAADGS